jgi:hypothetical protein
MEDLSVFHTLMDTTLLKDFRFFILHVLLSEQKVRVYVNVSATTGHEYAVLPILCNVLDDRV